MKVVRTYHRASLWLLDLLRLIAAFMVLWSHGFALIGIAETPIFGMYLGGIGVDIFFAISGYLNTQSLLRGQSWWRFLIRRARRIYPPVWLQPPIDISYGIYLFAFPVQQLIASCGLSFWPSLTLSLAVTTRLAILSAIFIEQPALMRPMPKIALAQS